MSYTVLTLINAQFAYVLE